MAIQGFLINMLLLLICIYFIVIIIYIMRSDYIGEKDKLCDECLEKQRKNG